MTLTRDQMQRVADLCHARAADSATGEEHQDWLAIADALDPDGPDPPEGDADHDDEDRRAYHEERNARPRPSEY